MYWYQYLALLSLVICLGFYGNILFKVIRAGNPSDYAKPAGNKSSGVVYAYTGAMNPRKKASAYLHLPTYTMGLIYHFGTFASIAWFFLSFFQPDFPVFVKKVLFFGFLLSGTAGFAILFKRTIKKHLRELSNPDDYISNFLVSTFHIASALMALGQNLTVFFYYLIASILLLYLPVGKLRHSIYFFAARYHLGVFFGSRKVWPPSKNQV